MVFSEHPYTTEEAERALERSKVGGGTTYTPQWTKADADVVISEPSEWDRADRHKVVYIADNETINVTNRTSFDLNGTAVIGGRHKPGVRAGKIVADKSGPGTVAYKGVFQALSSTGHLEGIQLRGPNWHPERAAEYQQLKPTDARCWPGYEHIPKTGTLASRNKARDNVFSRGLTSYASNTTVRNCDIAGFSHAGVSFGAKTRFPKNVTVAYNKLHNCAVPGLGYPLNIVNGEIFSEYNMYNAYRHSITGFGSKNMGYTTYRDVHGPDCLLSPVDMHMIGENGGSAGDVTAGKYLHATECTFLQQKRYETPGWYNVADSPSIGIRGRPSPGGGYTTRNCQFVHTSEAKALAQRNVRFPTSWSRSGNEYGGPENWSMGVNSGKGAPVDWDGAPTGGEEERHISRRARARALSEAISEATIA